MIEVLLRFVSDLTQECKEWNQMVNKICLNKWSDGEEETEDIIHQQERTK